MFKVVQTFIPEMRHVVCPLRVPSTEKKMLVTFNMLCFKNDGLPPLVAVINSVR